MRETRRNIRYVESTILAPGRHALERSRRADDAMDVLHEHSDYWRLLAFVCLESDDGAELHREFPTVAGLMERLRSIDPDAEDIGVRAAAGTALALGWVVFEPFLRFAAGLEAEDRADAAEVLAGLAAALERAVGVGTPLDVHERVDVPRLPRE